MRLEVYNVSANDMATAGKNGCASGVDSNRVGSVAPPAAALAILLSLTLVGCPAPRRQPLSVGSGGYGFQIAAPSGLYSLVVDSNWVPVGDKGGWEGSDLVIVEPEGGSTIFTHVVTDGDATIDSLVDQRRQTLAEKWDSQPIHERRYFLDSEKYFVASLARYGRGSNGRGKGAVILTVHAKELIEVVGLTMNLEADGPALEKILGSFALTARGSGENTRRE